MIKEFVECFAKSMQIVDSKAPQAANARKPEIKYSPGIGPFQEKKLIELVTNEMKNQNQIFNNILLEEKYPNLSRKKLDIFWPNEEVNYYIEAKAMRRLRNNGNPEEFIMVDLLSPYEGDGSVLGDIKKLKNSGFEGEKVILIYGYDYDEWPLDIAIDCFEVLAERHFCKFKKKYQFKFNNLIHPHHKRGEVFAWIID